MTYNLSTCLDVPTKFQINRTRHGGENASFVKPRFSRFRRFFGSFVCLQYKKPTNLETNMHANLGYQPEVSRKFQPNRTAQGLRNSNFRP
jgi:hypothetical protein